MNMRRDARAQQKDLPSWVPIVVLGVIALVLIVFAVRMFIPAGTAKKVTLIGPQGAQSYSSHYGTPPRALPGAGAPAGAPAGPGP